MQDFETIGIQNKGNILFEINDRCTGIKPCLVPEYTYIAFV